MFIKWEMKNRFKGLDLIECLINDGWRFVTLSRRQGARPSARKRIAKTAKWLSGGDLTNICERKINSK